MGLMKLYGHGLVQNERESLHYFKEAAMKIQGSGWVYLSTGGDIKTIANHAVRTDICMIIDWWEHAWALDYQSDKEAYLNNMWKVIDWDVCNQRL